MRKLALFLLPVLLLSACGIIGGKKAEAKDFCARVHTAEDAGVLGSLDGTETADELRAYQTTQEAVDYLGDHFPTKLEQPTKDFVAAYDELVAELTTAGFDATKVDPATLTDINQRIDAALGDMATLFKGQCEIDLAA